jgi:hypothetical protein
VDGAGGLNPPAPKIVFVVFFPALLANAEWHVRRMSCRQAISNAAKCVPVKSRLRSNGSGTIRFGRIAARVDPATATPGEGSGNPYGQKIKPTERLSWKMAHHHAAP